MIFSVIVPFLNEELYIEQCIKALIEQDFNRGRYELIFIDNGSVDSSPKIVQGFSPVTFLKEDKQGAYAARNKGLKIAKGEIIAFTDADCAVSSDWLTQIYRGMADTGAAMVLGERVFPQDSSMALKLISDFENAQIEYLISVYKKRNIYAYTNNMAVKTGMFKQFGDFLEHNSADTELLQRYICRDPDAKVAYLPKMKITHLEMVNVKVLLEKRIRYGENQILLREKMSYASFGYRTNLQAYKYCAKKNNYGFAQKIILFLVLIIRDLCFKVGDIRGYIKFFSKKPI